ncbi:hypothetical protein NX722_24780 [Endozoicomonas gorgoniicola]|uniref:Uncharacterized protein n=1 Tax=Endozoicomonas gorgoniicola TaxID=1234144 RepID=A0ABT3N2C4_9GAMM|nr:hypothetical protein [Endozoicomonas gorgoniicola]MCW7555782.1 hypothetical protein [Endozoicomonas gorgoniicola]
MPKASLLFCTLLYTSSLSSASRPGEIWYQKVWCEGRGGKIEQRLPDGRRVDCLTEQYAIEMDFASKWQEAIGQSLDYAMLTGKKAGVVLILNSESDQQHWDRLQKVVNHYQLPIQLWKLGP